MASEITRSEPLNILDAVNARGKGKQSTQMGRVFGWYCEESIFGREGGPRVSISSCEVLTYFMLTSQLKCSSTAPIQGIPQKWITSPHLKGYLS